MGGLSALLPLIKNALGMFAKAFLGYFLMKQGAQKEQLEGFKNEEKQIKKANQIKANVTGLSDAELRDLLRPPRNSNDKKD
jgi:hypothetical protein